MPGLVEIGPAVVEKILKFVNVFSQFQNYLPLEKDFHLNKGCFGQSLFEISLLVLK